MIVTHERSKSALALGLFFAVLSGLPLPLAAQTRPNVLLVMADDMGWTDLGAFGSEIETPHIDQLAERGVQFTNFHTSVSCSPTRWMLLTGTDNHVAGVGNMAETLAPNQVGKPGYEGHIKDRIAYHSSTIGL